MNMTDMEYDSYISGPRTYNRQRRLTSMPQDELGHMLLEFKREIHSSSSPITLLMSSSNRSEMLSVMRQVIIHGLHTSPNNATAMSSQIPLSPVNMELGRFGTIIKDLNASTNGGGTFFGAINKRQSNVATQATLARSTHPPSDFLHHVAHAAESWSMLRFRELTRRIKLDKKASQILGPLLENLHWAIVANNIADDDDESSVDDGYADEQVWQRFCVKIQGKPSNGMPSGVDAQGVLDLITMREDATAYFVEQILAAVAQTGQNDLVNAMLHTLNYSTCAVLFKYLWPRAIEIMSQDMLRNEVIPRIALACTVHKERHGASLLKTALTLGKSFVTPELVDSIMEYSAHMHYADCGMIAMEMFRGMITSTGIISAVLVASAKGHDHFLALLEVFIMERLDSEMTELMSPKANEPRKQSTSKIDSYNAASSVEGTSSSEFSDFASPFIYLWIGIAAYSGQAKHTTITSLISFYEDAFASLLEESITPSIHRKYIKFLFHMACRRNHWNVVWSLIENEWMPSDILQAVREAVSLGHQKILHILLESLLVADPKIKPPSGRIPLVFRKPSVLRALPLIAKRFPREVSWFLDELSNIPIPGCVPKTSDHDPSIQARLIRGIKLGKIGLADVTKQPDPSWPPNYIWDHVRIEGQLRRANAKSSTARGNIEYETESVICMAPDALVCEEALQDSNTKKSNLRETNALIRLLSTGDEAIILSPITQALMEYHWNNGHFWWRYRAQLFCVLCFITSCAFLFDLVVFQQSSGVPIDRTTLILVCTSTLLFSSIFLVQEIRQFFDDPWDYVTSLTNMMDLGIYIATVFIVFQGAIAAGTITPLIMAIVLLLCAFRLLLHLRIIPSIGPLVRITVIASINVLPILIPMSILAFAFAGGFFLIERGEVPGTRWQNLWVSIQYVITMITYDYNVLDDASRFDIFFLRMCYHVVYIIFFLNVIIALMTVNIAEISANTTAAWLVEVAELMVELELYWPYPMDYTNAPKSSFEHELLSNFGSIVGGAKGLMDDSDDYPSEDGSMSYASA
eukprot:jgi/Hompol1/5307/HPOL_004323-RA